MEYNKKAFTPEEVEKGLHLDLIKYLLNYNLNSEDYYEDIHITTDGYCTIVEWCDVCRDKEIPSGSFEFVGEDQYVLTEIRFPDNHHEYLFEGEIETVAKKWLEDNKEEFGNYNFDTYCKSFYEYVFNGRRFV